MNQQERKTIVLGVCGSIAAYKAADLVSRFNKHGVDIYAIMTDAAVQFLSPLTLETLSHHPVATDLFSRESPWEIEHISLAKRADVFLVAPASANFIGKYANGICDDMLTTTAMATTAPMLIAPAMNANMYLSAGNQKNLSILKERGCFFVEPKEGVLACGDKGIGKLAPVEDIVEHAMKLLYPVHDMQGKRVLISAGPTREAIDPVRYITNRSSGKMGYALAESAVDRGAEVTLVSGPVNLPAPPKVNRILVDSTEQMFHAMNDHFDACDICIMAAAPSDFTPVQVAEQKIKKQTGQDELNFYLRKTPDILAGLGKRKKEQFVCGFAAETNNVQQYAKQKMHEKRLDMIVANDVSKPSVGFDYDTNQVALYFIDGEYIDVPLAHKKHVAQRILDEISKRVF